jgi:hypothetical protein
VRSASEISQPASDQPHPCLRRRTRSAYATPGDGCTNLGACDDRYTITPAPHRERARRLGVGSNLAVPAPLRGIVRTRREEYPDGYVIRIGERLRLVEWEGLRVQSSLSLGPTSLLIDRRTHSHTHTHTHQDTHT